MASRNSNLKVNKSEWTTLVFGSKSSDIRSHSATNESKKRKAIKRFKDNNKKQNFGCQLLHSVRGKGNVKNQLNKSCSIISKTSTNSKSCNKLSDPSQNKPVGSLIIHALQLLNEYKSQSLLTSPKSQPKKKKAKQKQRRTRADRIVKSPQLQSKENQILFENRSRCGVNYDKVKLCFTDQEKEYVSKLSIIRQIEIKVLIQIIVGCYFHSKNISHL